jgi:hypothetical protein
MKSKFCRVVFVLTALCVGASGAHAEFIMNVQQVGPDVVVTGSGTLDLTGLSQTGSAGAFGEMNPSDGAMIGGPTADVYLVDIYSGASGPGSFGNGSDSYGNSGTGDVAGVFDNGGIGEIFVPSGYSSGDPLSNSTTYDNATLASLGLAVGSYTYTWNPGPSDDSLVVNIGTTPLPGALPLFAGGLGAFGLFGSRRKRNAQAVGA